MGLDFGVRIEDEGYLGGRAALPGAAGVDPKGMGGRDDAWDQVKLGVGVGGRRGFGSLGGCVCRADGQPHGGRGRAGSWRRCPRRRRPRRRYAFDSPERLNWHFIPRAARALPIKELSPEQRRLAFGLIQSGLAASGFLKATTIMSLEQILKELEKGSGPVRDPELYYLTIFGKPSDRGKWGWRVEGHHLSLNFVLEDGKIVAATPAFFGANPAEVRQGPRQGLRTLADREDRALRLLQALDENQRKTAIFAEKAPAEIRARQHAPAADRPGRRHRLRRTERRPESHAPGAGRIVRRGHARRGRQGLARRDRPAPAPKPSDSPGPGPPTAARRTPTASRGRPS